MLSPSQILLEDKCEACCRIYTYAIVLDSNGTSFLPIFRFVSLFIMVISIIITIYLLQREKNIVYEIVSFQKKLLFASLGVAALNLISIITPTSLNSIILVYYYDDNIPIILWVCIFYFL